MSLRGLKQRLNAKEHCRQSAGDHCTKIGTTGYNIRKDDAHNVCCLVHHQALMQGMSLLVPASFVTTPNVTALVNRARTKYLRHDTTRNPSKSRDTRHLDTSPGSPSAVHQGHHSSATGIYVPPPEEPWLAFVGRRGACEKHRRLQVQDAYIVLDTMPKSALGTNSRALHYDTVHAYQHEYQRDTIARLRLMQKKTRF
jgi:hypothetical protein